MSSSFESEFFENNRRRLRILFKGTAPIVLTANGVIQSGADMTFPFRQDSNFWYLTGIDEPDAILVMDKSKEYIILSEDYVHRAKFDGALTPEQIATISGVADVLDYKAGWARLNLRLKKIKHLATLAVSPPYIKHYGFYTNPARATLVEQIKSVNASIELLDLKQHLTVLRMIKQPDELHAIKRTIAVTAKTLTTVTKKSWTNSTTEQEIDNELLYQFRKHGADKLAFDNVVAGGKHTTTIHHIPGYATLPKNGLLLLDVGAEVSHYAADISRVYAIGKPSKRTQQVYTHVREVLEQALGMLKPGIIHSKFEEDVEQAVGEKLRQLGLIKTIDRQSVRRYFPHYTSHQLGLDAHDPSDYDKTLLPNMVLAIEPGIYIPEEGIGVRIEENILITPTGIKVLTSGLSRDLLSLTIKPV